MFWSVCSELFLVKNMSGRCFPWSLSQNWSLTDRPVGGSLKETDSECRKDRRESRLSSKRSSEDRPTSREEQQGLLGAGVTEYPSVQSCTSTPGCSPPAEDTEKTCDGEGSVFVHLNTVLVFCFCASRWVSTANPKRQKSLHKEHPNALHNESHLARCTWMGFGQSETVREIKSRGTLCSNAVCLWDIALLSVHKSPFYLIKLSVDLINNFSPTEDTDPSTITNTARVTKSP